MTLTKAQTVKKSKAPSRAQRSISVTAPTYARLKAAADKRGVTLASLVAEMVAAEVQS